MAERSIGPQEAVDGELRLELAARLPEIARLVEAFEAFAERLRFPPETVHQVTLVLDELVTNIVTYGVTPGEPEPITVELSQAGGVLRIVLSDPGRPFDPLTVKPPDLAATLDPAG
jgi:serine/threonine-protein kinase RsbW